MTRAIIRMIVVTALLAGLFAFIKFMVYGVSDDFGWGFLVGGLLAGVIAVLGMHVEMKDQLAKQREELLRDL
ncbi:putative PurR-regulated permease PerM [Angulomicrobium tetraedrale]|uniref:Putative PurR-regulated permease PerM n=1 Tax=Ancylobacter tetraedralis TaxID=217068 RepID=A0A839ZB97_9HYPH|nr:hypothetical protein [Ancylobacter tetraedralis]MBB3772019.1 putative PurR-regulated permease PerM [Ancylobacter tetraedralis]